jgi:isocitrate dehydrogenase
MLVHIDQTDVAERVHNAWLRTLEDGIHTYDIYAEGTSKEKVGTREFAQAVVARLGQKPEKLKAVSYKSAPKKQEAAADQSAVHPRAQKQLVGVDVFVDWTEGSANDLGAKMEQLGGSAVKLVMIDSRGTKVYPGGFPETITGDLWRCRFEPTGGSGMQHSQIIDLLGRIQAGGVDFVKIESLYTFDGQPGYSLGQGQ